MQPQTLGDAIDERVEFVVAGKLPISARAQHRPNEKELSHRWRRRALLSLYPSSFILQPFSTTASGWLEPLVRRHSPLGLASNSFRLFSIHLVIASGDCMRSFILFIASRCASSAFCNISLPCFLLLSAISSKV